MPNLNHTIKCFSSKGDIKGVLPRRGAYVAMGTKSRKVSRLLSPSSSFRLETSGKIGG